MCSNICLQLQLPPSPILYTFPADQIHHWFQDNLHSWQKSLVLVCQFTAAPFVQGATMKYWLGWSVTAALILSFWDEMQDIPEWRSIHSCNSACSGHPNPNISPSYWYYPSKLVAYMTCYSYFSSPCQPQHHYSNTPQNKTSHYNIMHQYTILSWRISYSLLFPVCCLYRGSQLSARAAGASYMHIFIRDTIIPSESLWGIPSTCLVIFCCCSRYRIHATSRRSLLPDWRLQRWSVLFYYKIESDL